MDASAIDRAGGDARGWQGLAAGEWAVVGSATVLLLSLTGFDWFAFSDREQIVVGSEGDAFRWLDGLDYALVLAALVAALAPLARLIGLVSSSPRDVAVVTGSAGLVAALVIVAVMISPPDLERGFLSVPVGGGATAETIVRGGAVVGLLAALGIAGLSALTILASPDAVAPVHLHPAPAPAPADDEPAPKPKPAPRPKPAARKLTTKPAPASRKRTKPKPPAKPRLAPKPARPSLATATADDLAQVGFTPTQAARIVEYRDDLGKVTKLSDLKRVPGIAKPVLAELVKRLDD